MTKEQKQNAIEDWREWRHQQEARVAWVTIFCPLCLRFFKLNVGENMLTTQNSKTGVFKQKIYQSPEFGFILRYVLKF